MKAIKRLFQLLILLPIGIVIILLAVANRHDVKLALDPFSPEQPVLDFQVPLYLVMFVSLMLGILIGGFMAWLKQGRHRRTAREKRYEAQKWRNEADRQQKRVEKILQDPAKELATELKGDAPALPAPAQSAARKPAA